ncbi:MAG TPA: hypothetical protein PK702_09640 [Burkholderiaceae bacterium]|nr:hypothetical protein [Burkholderiaceae bacterium]
MKFTIKSLLCTLTLGVALLTTGCATRNQMAFEDPSERITATSAPVYLMTVTIKNNYRNYQPTLTVTHIEKAAAKNTEDRLLAFFTDAAAKIEAADDKNGNTYFLRFQLPAGDYSLVGMTSHARSFPVMGTFVIPLVTPIQAKGNGVYYLGHIDATVRERKGEEFKAGPTIPLIDQAVTGASGGSFDIVYSDRLSVDEKTFKSKFKALEGIEIKKALMPAFDRQKAQKWWEAL